MHAKLRLTKIGPSLILVVAAILMTYINAASVYSGENGFIIYKLANGFNGNSTAYLPYNYIYHPILAYPVMGLYSIFPGLPWHSLFLFGSCLIACISLLHSFRQKAGSPGTWIFAVAIFCVFIRVFFAHLEFSYAAVLLSVAACVRLGLEETTANKSWKPDGWALFLLLLALAWRMHVVIPVLGIFLAYFITIGRYRIKRIAATLLLCFLGMLALHFSQSFIYTARDADWPQKEAYRNHVYQLYNDSALPADSNKFPFREEWELLNSGLLIDREFYLANWKLEQMLIWQEDIQLGASWPSLNEWKWTFINNRIYIAAYLLVLLLLVLYKRPIIPHLLALFFFIAGYLFLQLMAKIPSYLLVTGFTCLSIGGVLDLLSKDVSFMGKRKTVFTLAFLLLTSWGVLRMWKDGQQNRKAMEEFRSFQAMLSRNPDTLFIVSNNKYLQKMNAFVSPAKYPLSNYLDSEFFLHDEAGPVLRRYGVDSLANWPVSKNLLFVDRPPDGLLHYFRQVHGQSVEFQPVQGLSERIEIFRLQRN